MNRGLLNLALAGLLVAVAAAVLWAWEWAGVGSKPDTPAPSGYYDLMGSWQSNAEEVDRGP